jgi:hypothetical protein
VAFITRARFLDCDPVPRNSTLVKDADLPKTGQDDKTSFKKVGHEAKDGWFGIIFMDYSAEAGVNVAAGTATGGINKTTLKIIKQLGPLSPILMRALHNRALFNLRVECIDRTGQADAQNSGKVAYTIEFKTAVLQTVRQMTGDESYGSVMSTIAPGRQVGQSSDTGELEELTIVYQGAAFEWKEPSKKGTIELRGG